tara:strand:- start:6332 stop:6664 length:333 start_codon:yes stop_codon:yes gene_type:complete
MKDLIAEQVVKEMKSHPITLTLVVIATAAIGFGYYNFAYANEVELLKANQVAESKVNTCRWLSDKIDDLEVDIFNLKKAGANAAWIREKESDLRDKRERYRETTCSTMTY